MGVGQGSAFYMRPQEFFSQFWGYLQECLLTLMFAGFVPDSRVAPAEVVNHVTELVSSNERPTGFQDLLGDTDIDRFALNVRSAAQSQFYCRATATQ